MRSSLPVPPAAALLRTCTLALPSDIRRRGGRLAFLSTFMPNLWLKKGTPHPPHGLLKIRFVFAYVGIGVACDLLDDESHIDERVVPLGFRVAAGRSIKEVAVFRLRPRGFRSTPALRLLALGSRPAAILSL